MPRDTAHTSLKPCSRKVGALGMNCERSADITPSTRIWPALHVLGDLADVAGEHLDVAAQHLGLAFGVPRKCTIWKLVPLLAPMPSDRDVVVGAVAAAVERDRAGPPLGLVDHVLDGLELAVGLHAPTGCDRSRD